MQKNLSPLLRLVILNSALLLWASPGAAELLCDCTKVVDSCDASVTLEGTRVNIESSNASCSRVDYLVEGQPYTALIVGGSGELAGPSLPMRNASVVVENCRVCAENGDVAIAADQTDADSSLSPTQAADEDTTVPRSMIKVMPQYPRRALMNKLEGDVTVEFSVSAAGEVHNINIISSSSPLFDLPAIDAVSRFKFVPAEADGEAISTEGVRERFQFRLLQGGTQTRVTSSSG